MLFVIIFFALIFAPLIVFLFYVIMAFYYVIKK